ncbi:MAG TPA: hypothetical protein VGH27_02960 [Streptosporangiaceae bacterium]|jgi:hypothetical protein
MTRIALEPYFMHQEQVQALIGPQRTASAMTRMASRDNPEAAAPYILAGALAEALPMLGISELLKSAHEQAVHVGRVVGIEQELTFQRVRDRDAPGVRLVDFAATIDADEPLLLTGSFNSARTASASATGSLTGRKRVYLIGTITDLSEARIEIRPSFIGIRSFIEDDDLASSEMNPGPRIYPSEIGQFGGVDFRCPVTPAELKAVLAAPEQKVKNTIADLIGEPYVPKDWGGERSDLYTSRVFARGRQISSAWLFKGPGYPHPMTVRALGKPGDQIVRLFSEPAELLILQHCHEITPSVVNMMEAYAHDLRNPRKYMIIDGADTSRILKSQGLLPSAV